MNPNPPEPKQGSLSANSPPPGSEGTPNQAQRTVRSEELFQGQRELFILHGTQIYRLMETRNGKLILQK